MGFLRSLFGGGGAGFGAKLIEAVRVGDFKKAKSLLAKGADVNAKGQYGKTALMWASEKGRTEIVKALIDKGADVNVKDEDDKTALMWASEKDHTEIVKALRQEKEKRIQMAVDAKELIEAVEEDKRVRLDY